MGLIFYQYLSYTYQLQKYTKTGFHPYSVLILSNTAITDFNYLEA